MKQKIFLTSAIAMGFVAPAFAETFPSDGYMKENKTYDNAATADNMDDVYEGTVNAVAEYDVINYILSAGQYLPADSETPTTCPAGSYCSGIGEVQYDEENDQGLTSCPTAYSLSAAGAKTADECYRQCTSADVAHSKSTGTFTGMFYSNNTNACEPVNDASCANGYHYKAGTTGPNLTSLIGITKAGDGYTSNDSNGDDNDTDNMDNTIIANDPLAFAVDYGSKGVIKGHGRCSTRAGAANTWGGNPYTYNAYPENFVSSLTDETGEDGAQYCYCQLDSYTPVSGSATALYTPWVFRNDSYGVAGNCASNCASYCASYLQNASPDVLAFRAALFNSVQSTPAMCEANTITINWDDVDPEYAGQNNEGTATYGEDVRTPVKANTYKGKTFKGWKFSKPTTTQLPE